MSEATLLPAKAPRISPQRRAGIEFVLDNLVWLILLTVLIVFSLTIPNYFQIGIFANIIEQSTFVGVMAIGLALVIINGNIDLSVESTMALAAMATALIFARGGAGLGWVPTPEFLILPLSLLLSLFIGAAIGAANAFLVVKVKMNAFIVTLAAFIWVRGLVVAVSGGRSAQDLPPEIRFIGINTILAVPLTAWIAICAYLLFAFILNKTPFGRHQYLIGGNAVAAFRAGIRVNRLVAISFVLAGAIAGLAGWLLAIRTSGASANLGTGMLFHAFAAVVIGGVSLKGGIGRLSGVYAGVLLLSAINTAINLMGMPAHYTQIILGGMVLLAMLLDAAKISIRQRLL
jgi:ribose transport system permease protein